MVPQALGSLPQPLPAAHEPFELFRQTGGSKWFLLGEKRDRLKGLLISVLVLFYSKM